MDSRGLAGRLWLDNEVMSEVFFIVIGSNAEVLDF